MWGVRSIAMLGFSQMNGAVQSCVAFPDEIHYARLRDGVNQMHQTVPQCFSSSFTKKTEFGSSTSLGFCKSFAQNCLTRPIFEPFYFYSFDCVQTRWSRPSACPRFVASRSGSSSCARKSRPPFRYGPCALRKSEIIAGQPTTKNMLLYSSSIFTMHKKTVLLVNR